VTDAASPPGSGPAPGSPARLDTTADVQVDTQFAGGVLRIWLDRPALRNALEPALIARLTDAFAKAGTDASVRVVVLGGRGSAFCAGADLNWMKAAAGYGPQQNRDDAGKLAALLRAIAECPKPTIARVHGPAFAGGMGLVAACDMAVATPAAKFCLSETRLGLIPAMISPYVIRSIGERAAQRWFLTAEVFDAVEALRLGMVHQLVDDEAALDAAVDALTGHLLAAGPQALAEAKRLIRDVANQPVDDALVAETASRIAAVRASDEGREGIASFLEKRKPRWHPQA
jgi:methylglutaconyl-CoA hydratase